MLNVFNVINIPSIVEVLADDCLVPEVVPITTARGIMIDATISTATASPITMDTHLQFLSDILD